MSLVGTNVTFEPSELNTVSNSFRQDTAYKEVDASHGISLEQVITAAQFAVVFDVHHLPARTFLGLLYQEAGDLELGEYHLQKCCTQQKHRGCGSGRAGQTSVFGGYTSQWGWYSWDLLSEILTEQDRLQEASKVALYALELQKVASVRGYESLARF